MSLALGSRSISSTALATTLAKLARRQDGTAAIEFAIVGGPFIALLAAIMQTALVFFAGRILDNAVFETGRLLLTGQAQTAKLSQANFAQDVCAQLPLFFDCSKLMVDVQSASSFATANTAVPTLTFNEAGQVTNTWQYQPGGPGAIVVMRVMYQWPIFLGPLGAGLANLPNGHRLLMSAAAFKNEPYQ
jgi:Flp pilus assembly protein TadG